MVWVWLVARKAGLRTGSGSLCGEFVEFLVEAFVESFHRDVLAYVVAGELLEYASKGLGE